jgi:integrase
MSWDGGNSKLKTARPAYFGRELSKIKTTITVQKLASIQKLPVMQMMNAMQELGSVELKSMDSIEKLCNVEIAYLLGNIKPNTVASTITAYRRVLDSEGFKDHPYQLYFKMPHELMTERKTVYQASVMAENKALRPFSNIAGYIELSTKLMRSKKSYIRVAMGLCAVTGRRPSEILITAKFTKTGEYSTVFSGQLKTKDSELSQDNYEIPLLVPADDVINALAELRGKRDFSGLPVPTSKTLAQVVNLRTAKAQSECVKTYFNPFIDNPHAYNLRAVYAMLCSEKHKPADMTQQAYIASILGHSENDSTTAASYLDFYIKE